MKITEVEWIKDVLERMNKKERAKTIKTLEKLDREVSPELARDIVNSYETVGMGIINFLYKRAKEK